MKFLEIIFGKLLDFFFKKDSGSGISIKNDKTQFQARDISNTTNSNNTTYQQTVIINPSKEAAQPISDIEVRHQNFWGSIIHGFMLGATAFLAIMMSAVNVDMYHKADLFQKVLFSNHWIILGCLTVGIILRKKFIGLIDRVYQFIFSDDRKERMMVIFGSNTLQHKMYLILIFLAINAVLVFYLAKGFFLIIT